MNTILQRILNFAAHSSSLRKLCQQGQKTGLATQGRLFAPPGTAFFIKSNLKQTWIYFKNSGTQAHSAGGVMWPMVISCSLASKATSAIA
jgi:hypothetical protein